MIPIYICEDIKEQLDAIAKIIENFIFINSFDMDIKGCFQEPDMLIACIKRNEPVTGLYFLDIDLKSNIDGVKLAEIIREYDARAFIVFITTHEKMAIYTLKKRVEPLDFIIKGTSDFAPQIEKCLKNTLKKFSAPSNPVADIITVRIADNSILLKRKDILFVESSSEPHKIIIHKEKEQLAFRSSLKNISSQLGKGFFKCHGSFIVNVSQIKEIDKKQLKVYFFNGESCPCSTRLYGNLLKQLANLK